MDTAEDFNDFVRDWFPGASEEAIHFGSEVCARVMNDPMIDAKDGPIEVLMHLTTHANFFDNKLARELLQHIRREDA